MDFADVANEFADHEREFRIEVVRHAPPPVRATGACLHCGEPVTGRWCDAGCRDDWQKRNRG